MSTTAADQYLKPATSTYILYLVTYVNSLVELKIIKYT